MPVPLLDVSRQHAPLKAECMAAFSEIFDSGRYILGDQVEAFEAALAEFTDTRHAIGVSSGTDALVLALMALGVELGDEVLCPAFTFFATAGSIARLGAVPVWVDVLADSFNLDLTDASAKISPKTKGIIPVHLFGQMCEMDDLQALASEHDLWVLEDAAQAIGSRYKDRPAGSLGAFGCFSFYPTKNLGALGDAGAITTQDDSLAERARRLRNHGMFPRYTHHEVGGNFRLDALQAAFLFIKLKHLPVYEAGRHSHAVAYQAALSGVAGIDLPVAGVSQHPVWNQFTIRVRDGKRDALKAFLAERKIGSEIYYPLTLDQQPCFAGVGRGAETIRVAHELAGSVLSLPIFPEMTPGERDEVIGAILDWSEEG